MSSTIELERIGLKNNEKSQVSLLVSYIFGVLPQVRKRMNYWTKIAKKINDETLRLQALASLDKKAFHCQGGAVYAVHNHEKENLLDLIVSYQTICDYLDNLCDRAGITEEEAFATLHQSLLDALTPNSELHNYYQNYAHDEDKYLYELVRACQNAVQRLPSYHMIYDDLIALAKLYIDLQVKKHLDWSQRERVLIKWAQDKGREFPFIKWQEFSAATGSTLALFALFRLASQEIVSRNEIEATINAYFPWICGLHILLDYYIDQAEDKIGGDLNFTFYYQDSPEMLARLKLFSDTALSYAQGLPDNTFHRTVVQGLLAMYLSDAKVKEEGKYQTSSELLKNMGQDTVNIYRLCSLVRKMKVV